jgi:tryptophan 2,3-dioxygenase
MTHRDGAHMDFSRAMSYGDYLELDRLLDCQHPKSDDHNELLFIIQHQATELWLKLVLHELDAARAQIAADDLQPAFKMLARVSRIFAQLVQAWDVLSTLTPSEYSAFRPSLGAASGFQSHQYRMLEFRLGNRDRSLLPPFAHRPAIHAALAAELARPSLYDEALRLLARRGFAIPPSRVEQRVERQVVAVAHRAAEVHVRAMAMLGHHVTSARVWKSGLCHVFVASTSRSTSTASHTSTCRTYRGVKPKRSRSGARKSPMTPRAISACITA